MQNNLVFQKDGKQSDIAPLNERQANVIPFWETQCPPTPPLSEH